MRKIARTSAFQEKCAGFSTFIGAARAWSVELLSRGALQNRQRGKGRGRRKQNQINWELISGFVTKNAAKCSAFQIPLFLTPQEIMTFP